MSLLQSISPWDGSVVWRGVAEGQVDQVLSRAADAWAARPSPALMHGLLRRLAERFAAERASAIELLVREAGKTSADAATEADLLVRKIDLSLGVGLARTPLVADPANMPPGWAGPSALWRPRGVALCVGPFNFPLHLLNGLVVPALAVGCPVIAKPSERCPGLGSWYRDRIREAGLEPYVQVVQGGPELIQALVTSSVVATVAAVGSRRMGLALANLLAPRPEVVLALELGGVNHALLCSDVELAHALPALADGAWRMAGQRCTATRIVHVPRAMADEVTAGLQTARRTWLADGTPQAALGPLISVAERERFQEVFRAEEPGWKCLAGSRTDEGAFAEPLLIRVDGDSARSSSRYMAEHFGPYLIMDAYDDEAEAIRRMQQNQQRLSAAIWTTDAQRFTKLAPLLPYGLVNWNNNTAGARSDQPFGGCGLSGNGRPAALAAGAIFADETVVG